MTTHLLVNAEAEKHQRRLLAEELPVRKSGVLACNDGMMPTVWVDLAGRRDVAKLWRAHAKTGEGDFRVDWYIFKPRHRGRLFVGEWVFSNPVRCSFSLVWDAVEDLPFLEGVCRAGCLMLTQRNPERPGVLGECLALVINTRCLGDMLTAARTLAALPREGRPIND